ncbi:MAG: transporter substrate-binding domain-containing protein [Legionella sp.]
MQAYDPPFSLYADKSHYFGFEVALMDAICKEINAQCQYSPGSYNDLLTGVSAGKLDLAIGAITIDNKNKAKYLFSLPYLNSNSQLMTLINSPINSVADIRGKRLGTWKDELFKQIIEEKFSGFSKIKEYTRLSDFFEALAHGDVDVILIGLALRNLRCDAKV